MPATGCAEIVRQAYDAFNRDDIDWIHEHAHEDLVWRSSPEDPERWERHGLDEAVRGMRAIRGFLEQMHSDIESLEERDESVICEVRHAARMREGGAEIERREVHVWTFRGDKVAEFAEFPDLETARKELGAGG
jgi:ketosteroid isomerase-like protein